MPSPTFPAPRRLIHTRHIRTRGFLRDDGLWEIEGELLDEKTYTYADRDRGRPRPRPEIDIAAIPFALCAGAADPAKILVGKSLGRGFSRAMEDAMGGTSGCTHVRYLVLALANTAYQTISAYREQFIS
jgi:hypothetical protein